MSTKVSRKRNMATSQYDTASTRRYEKFFVIAALAFFVVYPFIARLNIITVTDIEQLYFSTTQGRIVDIALYSKEIAIAAFAAVAILFFIGERIFTDRPEPLNRKIIKSIRLPLILVGVIFVFETLSLIFSEYADIAFIGVHTEYEGYLALVSYLVVFMFGFYYMRKDDCISFLKTAIIVLSVIIGVLCIVEISYKALLEFRFVQHLISPQEYYELAESIQNLYFDGQSALLFNNPGFLGGFAALILPVDLALVFDSKNVRQRVESLIATAMMGIAIYGSASKAGMLSLLVSVPLCIIFGCRGKVKRVLILTAIAVVCAAAFIGGTLLIRSFFHDSVTGEISESTLVAEEMESRGELYRLDKAELSDGELTFTSGENTFVCSVDIDRFVNYMITDVDPTRFTDCIIFSDGEKKLSDMEVSFYDNDRVNIHLKGVSPCDDRFKMITVATEGQMVYFCFGYDGPVQFAMTEKGFMSFIQGEELEDHIPQPKITGLESFYGFATGRGYIWIQSLPILAECLLIGKGCGNFPFNFVQNELVGLINTNGSSKYVIDRPHNRYLQTAIANGLPALICTLALFIYVIVAGLKMIAKEERERAIFDVGLLAGLVGFMITGLINDSCITVDPFFWLLIGVFVRRIANYACKDKNTMI